MSRPISRLVLDAFLGQSLPDPYPVKVRYKDASVEILVSFGEIRIPVLRFADIESLQEAYRCRIYEKYPYYQIVPDVVSEIIEHEGFLSSANKEHLEKLEKWFREFGIKVIAEVISEEGFRKVKKKGVVG